MGVLPVPPVLKFPMQITGSGKLLDLKTPMLNSRFLMEVIPPYIREKGHNSNLQFIQSKLKIYNY
tara:strand:+ start:26243 stop:26437 length:195 start_codon:yes stop_codon:yes gene_type:complete